MAALSGTYMHTQTKEIHILTILMLLLHLTFAQIAPEGNYTQMLITSLNANNNSPVLSASQYSKTIREDIAVGSSVLSVAATDADSGLNGQIIFSFVNCPYFTVTTVAINKTYIGTVTVARNLDYDSGQSTIQCNVTASDLGTPPRSTTAPIAVFLQNVNDNPPTIINTTSTFNINETAQVGTVVTVIQATDMDGDAIKFYFAGKVNFSEIFTIRETGQVYLSKPIPAEKDSYTLSVIGVDDDSCCAIKTKFNTATATFTVNIVGVNLNRPVFYDCLVYDTTAFVKEKAPPGTFIIQVHASDTDRGINGIVTYRIVSPDPDSPNALFKINSTSGNISVKGEIIRDQSGFVQITVVGSNPPDYPLMEGSCTFRITVMDINDNPPTFSQAVFLISISISTRPPALIYQIAASDKDVGANANITYSFAASDNVTMNTFSINAYTGVIILEAVLDPSIQTYNLTVIANDNGIDPGPKNATANVIITVSLNGATPPSWINLPTNSTFSVSEKAPVNYVITALCCQSNSNDSAVEFRVYDSSSSITTDSKNFRAVEFIESGTYCMNLTLRNQLVYDPNTKYLLSVACQSFGLDVLRAPLFTPVIVVLDANNNIPQFLGLNSNGRYSASVPENSRPGTFIIQVSAYDMDSTAPFNVVTFILAGPNKNLFQINHLGNNRADILTSNLLNPDRETIPYYTTEVCAMDGAPASPPNPTDPNAPNIVSRYLDIVIADENDNPPIFLLLLYTFNVSENAAVSTTVGIVSATDPDAVDQIGGLQYRITEGNFNNAFIILSGTGRILLATKLDYENPLEPKVYNLTVIALDQNQLHTATTIVLIIVLDVNDNRPVCNPNRTDVRNIVTEEDTSITSQNPLYLITVTATDADKRPETEIRYSIFGTSTYDSRFTVDAVSGRVSLIGSLDREIPPYYYYLVTVEARDESVNPLSCFCDIFVYPMDINDNRPVIIAQYLQGTVNENAANAYVMTLIAQDPDEGNNGTVRFQATAAQPNATLSAMFTVHDNGDIFTTNNVTLLDHETIQQVLLGVQAYDLGTPVSLSSTATATITVLDVNDQSPYFLYPLYSASVRENQTSGSIMSVSAIDLDSDPRNKNLVYSLQGDPNVIQFFYVTSSGGIATISVAKEIDYETNPHNFTFILNVTDGMLNHTNTTTIQIFVLDYNDNAPVFNQSVQSVTLQEEFSPGTVIATFTATDSDEGINAEIRYSIVRASDPGYEIYIDPLTGVVTNRKKLDREVHPTMTILFLATDGGEIPLSATATLYITLIDINDNGPRFREDYRPVVPENVDNSNTVVQVIYAYDPDTSVNGPPFGFALPTPCPVACNYFSLTFDATGDGGNGSATVRTSSRFDRELQKYYYLPIVMWDRRGQSDSVTAINTLTITIGDENDNNLYPGNQNIFIYNYEGQFTNYNIGRVYAEDLDDWDLPDKTFTYNSPDNLKNYFSIDAQTGMITLKPGLFPNDGQAPYQFTANVFDKKFQKTVTCTVSVTLQIIKDEAVRNSGGVRLNGITAEEFIKPISVTQVSKYEQFRISVASMLNYPSKDSVQIVSLIDGEDFLDVWFSAHGSPYVKPSQGESAIMLNTNLFEKAVGVQVVQVPINLCMNETSDIGCYNYFDVPGQPELVNANGTSYVMVLTSLAPKEGCVDTVFPDPVVCQGDYCFNGGTCLTDDWGKLSCACSSGFDGPRCQQSRHSFDGKSVAFYDELSVCAHGRTSIDFITLLDDGLIMYSGPITAIDPTQDVHDYLILELKAGYPSLRLNLGGNEVSLTLTGKDKNNALIMAKLSDGQWHHLDIDRNNQRVILTVDNCKYASTTNGTVTDWSPCRIVGIVPGPDVLLNVNSLLQLGGRYSNSPSQSYPSGVTTTGFTGSLKNLVHNSKLYDLYYRDLLNWNSGTNGCPREDAICGQGTAQPNCGQNATCVARWQPDQVVTCRCNPGWYGQKCDKVAPTKDIPTNSYFAWDLKPAVIANTAREGSFQLMYRTRQGTGTLFALTNANLKSILLQLVNGTLLLSYDMGQGKNTLGLPNAAANSGQWSTVRVERYGNGFLLTMDGGEGRDFSYRAQNIDLRVFFQAQPRVTVGAYVTGTNQVNDALINTCFRDIRFNDNWLPMTTGQNSDPDAGASLVQAQGIQNGCVRDDCGPSVVCPPTTFCYPLWEKYECRCYPGNASVNGVCVPSCNPNPCLNFGFCNIVNGVPICNCPPGWGGTYCGTQQQVNSDDAGLGAGAIVGIVLAILFLLLLLILLLLCLLTRKRSEKEKFIEVDPDDDFIRENVVFYDEEGAGEEDHAAYDIRLLQKPVRETSAKPIFNPVTEADMRRQNAPQLDRPDIAPRSDRPDVGNFIKDRINDAENDDPMNDSSRQYNYEGGNSDAGSLSSLNTSSSGGSQDYDYLSSWGPKFAKLADMYGAGQNQDDV